MKYCICSLAVWQPSVRKVINDTVFPECVSVFFVCAAAVFPIRPNGVQTSVLVLDHLRVSLKAIE